MRTALLGFWLKAMGLRRADWRVTLCSVIFAFATTRSGARAQAQQGISLDWVTFVRYAQVAPSAVNPENQVFLIPAWEFNSELRPALRINGDANNLLAGLTFVARPILRYATKNIRAKRAISTSRSWNDAYFNELYGGMNFPVGDGFFVTYGIQNAQWGPAELASPSNPIFHDLTPEKDYFLLTRGRLLTRANLLFGKGFALTAIGETAALTPPVGTQAHPFESKTALKAELTSASGASQLALVGAVRERSRPFLGTFAQTEIGSGLSVYADAGASYGSQAWYPKLSAAPGMSQFVKSKSNADFLNAETVLGAREAFAGGTDLRLEYYFQSAGWSKQELREALQIASTPQLAAADNLRAYAVPGTLLPGRSYLYVSLREPNIPLFQSSEMALRAIYALADGSARASAVFEANLSESSQAFLQASASCCAAELELTRENRWSALTGYKLSF